MPAGDPGGNFAASGGYSGTGNFNSGGGGFQNGGSLSGGQMGYGIWGSAGQPTNWAMRGSGGSSSGGSAPTNRTGGTTGAGPLPSPPQVAPPVFNYNNWVNPLGQYPPGGATGQPATGTGNWQNPGLGIGHLSPSGGFGGLTNNFGGGFQGNVGGGGFAPSTSAMNQMQLAPGVMPTAPNTQFPLNPGGGAGMPSAGGFPGPQPFPGGGATGGQFPGQGGGGGFPGFGPRPLPSRGISGMLGQRRLG